MAAFWGMAAAGAIAGVITTLPAQAWLAWRRISPLNANPNSHMPPWCETTLVLLACVGVIAIETSS